MIRTETLLPVSALSQGAESVGFECGPSRQIVSSAPDLPRIALYKKSNDAYNPTRLAGPPLGQSIPNRKPGGNLERHLHPVACFALVRFYFCGAERACCVHRCLPRSEEH